ncbi:MAG: RNA-guided endonuclease InsQ/TnpB family protein, partial [Bacillati bacterium]
VQVCDKRARLPVIGWVAMREKVRFAGRILSVTISRQAEARSDASVVGVDLGITALATLSDGTPKVPAPKPLRRYLQKLKRLSRALSRKQRGSRNRAKAKTKLVRLHRHIADIRADVLHKLTTHLTRYRTVVIEDLNVAGMLANRHLSRAIADVGFFEFRRQLDYKTAMAGSTLVVADRWYASSKLCSVCEAKNEALTLSERIWTCASCGTSHDRDINAAVNLARYPESSPGAAHGAEGTGGEDHLVVKPAA